VGLDIADDAAVYKLNDDQAIITTTDFFTPVVDDPYDFGAIAAANSMSDVYAMGGEVLFALNIAAFPPKLEPAIITEIMRGGLEKVIEAGAIVAGGHTIQDEEPKYGLAVTGLVHPDRIFTKGGAKPGDVLVLTKPLGTGTISTALKRSLADDAHVAGAVDWMKRLNRAASRAAQQVGEIRAVTDITGFGLLGHGFSFILSPGKFP
jgi:selenide, water dikinase